MDFHNDGSDSEDIDVVKMDNKQSVQDGLDFSNTEFEQAKSPEVKQSNNFDNVTEYNLGSSQ